MTHRTRCLLKIETVAVMMNESHLFGSVLVKHLNTDGGADDGSGSDVRQ